MIKVQYLPGGRKIVSPQGHPGATCHQATAPYLKGGKVLSSRPTEEAGEEARADTPEAQAERQAS
jgi:hypothetical protein